MSARESPCPPNLLTASGTNLAGGRALEDSPIAEMLPPRRPARSRSHPSHSGGEVEWTLLAPKAAARMRRRRRCRRRLALFPMGNSRRWAGRNPLDRTRKRDGRGTGRTRHAATERWTIGRLPVVLFRERERP
jgi:hypothetical protein